MRKINNRSMRFNRKHEVIIMSKKIKKYKKINLLALLSRNLSYKERSITNRGKISIKKIDYKNYEF
jgi:hypothetical protein